MKTEIRSNWSHAVLVCKKCSRKSRRKDGGFGPDGKPLAKALKRKLGTKKGRKAPLGIIEVPCLDICPKRGVVMVDTRRPGEWRIVAPGADIDDLAQVIAGEDPR
jgi:predicted metal-binding protein